jgi:hypothetical protein
MDMQTCLTQAQMDQQTQATALGKCASDAATCGQSAKSFADAMTCRQSFQDCVSKVVQLPSPPTTPPPPTFPMLPPGAGGGGGGSAGSGGGAGGGLAGANECRQAALTCVQAAKSPADVATCADGYNKCITALLPMSPPPPPSGGGTGNVDGPDLSKLQMCQQTALSCVQAAKGASDVAKCNDAYRTCAGLPAVPSLPTPPTGGGTAGAGGGLPGGFPGGLPGGGTDCLQSLGQCLLTGGMPQDCASKARACAGLPAVMLPTPPSFPGLPTPPH